MKYTRSSAPLPLLNTQIWPSATTSEMKPENRREFDMWQQLVEMYVRGAEMRKALSESGVTHGQLLRRFRKCISIASDGRPFGWRGLLPGAARKPYSRSREPGKTVDGPGALRALFDEAPEIERILTRAALGLPLDGVQAEPMQSPKDIHRLFIRLCKDKGLHSSHWPFSTRWLGKRTINEFIKRTVEGNPDTSVRRRFGDVAGSKAETGTGLQSLSLAEIPFDVVELDSHQSDVIGSIWIETPSGPELVSLERLHILLYVDANSTCVTGSAVVI